MSRCYVATFADGLKLRTQRPRGRYAWRIVGVPHSWPIDRRQGHANTLAGADYLTTRILRHAPAHAQAMIAEYIPVANLNKETCNAD